MSLKKMISHLKHILNAGHHFDETQRLLMYKFQTLMLLIFLASSVVFAMVFVRYFQANYTQMFADLLFLFIALFGVFLLHKCKANYYRVARGVLFGGFSIAIWLLHSVPQSQSNVVWFSMIVAIMFFMLNKKEGIYWLSGLIIVLVALFLSGDFFAFSLLDFTIFIANLIMLTFVLLWYETIKSDNEKYVLNYTRVLEEQIEDRTKELQSALVEAQSANNAKDAFFANMSHELRTPLNAIIGFSQILEKQEGLDVKSRTFVEKINIAGNNLLRLINTILNFSKIESDKMELNLESVDLTVLIEEMLVLVEPQIKAKEIMLHKKIASATLEVDRQLFGQALLNLLSNAVKFTPNVGEIRVELTKEAQRVVISVCDTGIGIEKSDQEVLFRPFTQVKSSYQAQVSGTGLGLYLSAKIIAFHGGSIKLQSELGQGSCFSIVV